MWGGVCGAGVCGVGGEVCVGMSVCTTGHNKQGHVYKQPTAIQVRMGKWFIRL